MSGGITSSTAERSPFPYEGKALTRPNLVATANVGRGTSDSGERSVADTLDRGRMLHFTGALSPSPGRGRGTALAVDEVMRRNEFYLPPQIQAHFITLGNGA